MQVIEVIVKIGDILQALFSNQAAIAFVAAFIGGSFTSRATTKAHKYNEKKTRLELIETTKNSLKLIKVELMSAWAIYETEYAPNLKALPDGAPYLHEFPIGENIFPIYDSAPACLANIDSDTSADIIHAYMRIKGLIAMIHSNNANGEIAAAAGRKMLEQMIKVSATTDFEEESLSKHQVFYEKYVVNEAIKLGMGKYTDAMKALTYELENLLNGLEKKINDAILALS